MIVKVFKIVWMVSLLAMMASLIYSYASWPEEVAFDETLQQTVGKGILFYSIITLVAVLNALIFLIRRLNTSEAFVAWYYGMLISFHVFLVSTFIFITILNSMEKYNYSRIGPSIYTSIFVLIGWMIAWPIYYFIKPKSQTLVG